MLAQNALLASKIHSMAREYFHPFHQCCLNGKLDQVVYQNGCSMLWETKLLFMLLEFSTAQTEAT